MHVAAGVMLLGNVKLQASLNSHANFKNFPSAMLVLFRVATGDDWAGIMQVNFYHCFLQCFYKPDVSLLIVSLFLQLCFPKAHDMQCTSRFGLP